jgi:DNA-binding response OmpR family regulator
MAEQEGIETITNIRQASEDVPIIAISGAGDLSLEDAVLMGANMRFNKPFSIDDLLAAIAVLLSEAEEEGGPPGGEASP